MFYAVCVDGCAFLVAVATDQPDALNYIRKQRDKWSKTYAGKAEVTVKLLAEEPKLTTPTDFKSE